MIFNLYFAPVQGHTDAAYRHFHSLVYGGEQIYFTPFIRLEKNDLRPRDLKDLNSELNKNTHLIPQIIFREAIELDELVNKMKENGEKEIDLNMGCPFPLQTGHGRGAATILNTDLAHHLVKTIESNPEITFSVKMRLGMVNPDEWKTLLPYLNEVKLSHLTLHPRVAKQQYGGEVNLEAFGEFLQESKNPVVYNGDLKYPSDLTAISEKFPQISGLMAARGILGRPSLFNEWREGQEWSREKRIDKMLEFHRLLFNHYSSILCGDSQIISKIQPFWEYAEEEIGRKAWKAIKKASNISKYQTAVAMI
ncbi:MAG: tRNA-dihydrouridine synthase family protein [Muribaculaceae bacterium]|nr:tRNA-dihydrouridine synthase family protein [Muribaculaceae bacterium]